jgi:hypothetical protein
MAGKGFTVKKNWDNPIEHAMPAFARVPAEMRIGPVLVSPATVLAPMPASRIRFFGVLFVMQACLPAIGDQGSGTKDLWKRLTRQ